MIWYLNIFDVCCCWSKISCWWTKSCHVHQRHQWDDMRCYDALDLSTVVWFRTNTLSLHPACYVCRRLDQFDVKINTQKGVLCQVLKDTVYWNVGLTCIKIVNMQPMYQQCFLMIPAMNAVETRRVVQEAVFASMNWWTASMPRKETRSFHDFQVQPPIQLA